MAKKNETKFKIFSNEEYDRIFEELKKLPKRWGPKRINKEVQKRLTLTIIPSQPLTKEICDTVTFHRVRVFNEGDAPINENELSSFSYPPKEFCKMGRANRKGQQVLYTSHDYNTPFHEMSAQIKPGSSVVYLSKWKFKGYPGPKLYRSVFLGVPVTEEEDYSSIFVRGLNKGISHIFNDWPEKAKELFLYGQKKYTELFTIKGEDYYHITSSLVHDTFSEEVTIENLNQKVDIPILTYPSVAKDNRAVNFAFKKDFVDNHMEIVEVYKVVVNEINDETISTSILNKAIVENGKLKWLTLTAFDFDIKFSDALVSTKNNPGQLRKLLPDEALTTCCEKHKVTVKQFLERNKITEKSIIEGLSGCSVDGKIDEFPEKVVRALVTNPTKLYLNNDVSENGLIKSIVVPITYSLKYA